MKTNQETIPKTPTISVENNLITINKQSFHHSVLLDQNWSITDPKLTTPEEWIASPLRKPVAQIIAWPNLKPTPHLLDQFWDVEMTIELLTLSSAIKQAKSLIGSHEDFQLLIFPKNYDNSG